MSKKREFPYDFTVGNWTATSLAHGESRPANEYQALMECPPGVEPDEPLDSLAPLREVLADAILTTLDERELWVFEALHYRKLSLRQLGRELAMSKTHVARLRDEIQRKLQAVLIEHPQIKERIHE